MIHVKADYDDPTSATISIRGLPKGWEGADLRAGFVTVLESLLAEANDADEVPGIGPVRVAARKNYEDTDEDGDTDDEVDDGPTLRVGSAPAGLGLRKVEYVDPVDIADAAFPDDNDLNLAVVKLLRLAELRMQYAAAGRKVSGRMDMQKLWDLDRNIARARREAWTRIGKEEKEYE